MESLIEEMIHEVGIPSLMKHFEKYPLEDIYKESRDRVKEKKVGRY